MTLSPSAHDGLIDRPPSILVVCHANMCRSPAMEFLLGQGLREVEAAAGWCVTSAGSHAVAGSSMCSTSARALATRTDGREFADRHRTRMLSAEMIERSTLILVASGDERAAVTALLPSARARTFTFLEGGAMSADAADRSAVGVQHGCGRAPALLTLSELVRDLGGSRGRVALPRHPGAARAPRWRREQISSSQWDVHDAHAASGPRHSRVMQEIDWASRTMSTAVARLLTGSAAPRDAVKPRLSSSGRA